MATEIITLKDKETNQTAYPYTVDGAVKRQSVSGLSTTVKETLDSLENRTTQAAANISALETSLANETAARQAVDATKLNKSDVQDISSVNDAMVSGTNPISSHAMGLMKQYVDDEVSQTIITPESGSIVADNATIKSEEISTNVHQFSVKEDVFPTMVQHNALADLVDERTTYGDNVSALISSWYNDYYTRDHPSSTIVPSNYDTFDLETDGHNGTIHCLAGSTDNVRPILDCRGLTNGRYYRLKFESTVLKASDDSHYDRVLDIRTFFIETQGSTAGYLQDVDGNQIVISDDNKVNAVIQKTTDWDYIGFNHLRVSTDSAFVPFDVIISNFDVKEYFEVNDPDEKPELNSKCLVESGGVYANYVRRAVFEDNIRISKNLVDINDLSYGYYADPTNGWYRPATNADKYIYTNKIVFEDGVTYSMQGIGAVGTNRAGQIVYFDSTDNMVGRTVIYPTLDNPTDIYGRYTFIYSNNAYPTAAYCRIMLATIWSYNNSGDYDSSICQVEVGDTCTEIVPYLSVETHNLATKDDVVDIAKAHDRLMKVTKNGTTVYVRSKLSDENDIIIKLHVPNYVGNSSFSTNNVNFHRCYIGPKTLTDDVLATSTYQLRSIDDVIAPLLLGCGYIYVNHGWCTPLMTAESHGLTNDDLGSIWKDENEHQFTIGNINGNDIHLLPKITEDASTGVYTFSWKYGDDYPTTLTHVSGATHTSSISGSSSRFDLSVQTCQSRHFLADGKEIQDGVCYCNEFIVKEHIIGHNVGKVTSWFPTPSYNGTAVEFDRSFIFKGSCVTCNTVVDFKYPTKLTSYRLYQPMMPKQFGDYHSFTLIPKVKAEKQNHRVDLPFNSDNGTYPRIEVGRTENDLYDVNNQPDRIITYLIDNSDNYLVGMAAGGSLLRGISTDENRNAATPIGDMTLSYGGSSSDTENKLYPAVLLTDSMFANGFVPDSFICEGSCYFSWFDPAVNKGQVYWYKDGEDYIVYAHCQEARNKCAVNLPDFLEGFVVEGIVEKTSGAALLSEKVIGGRLYVSYQITNNYANYIVVKLTHSDNALKNKKKEDSINALEDKIAYKKEESPYNDNDVHTYFADEGNKVFAIQHKDGSIEKLALTKEERQTKELLKNLSSETGIDDDGVLKYLVDEDNTCFGYIKEDGTVVLFKAEIQNQKDGGESASEQQFATVVSLLANSADNIELSNNPKFMNTLHNLLGDKPVHINKGNDNDKNLSPRMSIIDDDTIDNQIPSSFGGSSAKSNEGGYFSVLLPFLLSLGAKHGKNLCAGLACEGHRVGLTPLYSADDSYTELNENGRAVKWLHDNMGWNVFNHSMTAQLPTKSYFVDGINSALADTILARGYYRRANSFHNTRVLDRLTGKWYEVNSTKTAWVELNQKKYAMPFYLEYINPNDSSENANHAGPMYFNRNFDFDYSWGEWLKRADELGLPYEKVIVHNGQTSHPCTISAGRKYAYWSVRITGTHNLPPLAATVNRKSIGTGSNNVRNTSYENTLKNEVDTCIKDKTWMVFMSHFNDQEYHRNYYLSGVTYPDGDPNYPSEWIIPLKHEEIQDIIGNNVHDYIHNPPSRLGISTWDEWYPAPGTQLKSLYDVIDYALTQGVEFVSPMEGWSTHGNILNLGVDVNGQIYNYDTKNQTPYTDDEKSYLTIGADMSIRYYNSKQ